MKRLLLALLGTIHAPTALCVEWSAPEGQPKPASTATVWQVITLPASEQPSQPAIEWQSKPSLEAKQLAWELVPEAEAIDPAVAVAAQEAREKAFKKVRSTHASPFRPYRYTAYLGGAQPTAYVEQWGEGFIAGYGGLPNEVRDFNFESNLNLGLGLGDPDRLLAITAGWDIGSTKNFNANGSFNIRAGRVLMETPRLQVSAGGGVIALAPYGNESGEDPTNGYGVITFATPLRPGRPDFAQLLQFSFGIGGNDYAPAPDGFPEEEMGYFFALGMQVSPRIGLSIGRSGRGANAVMSVLPNIDLPFYVEMLGIDLFSETPGGTKGVFGIRFGGRNLYRPQGH